MDYITRVRMNGKLEWTYKELVMAYFKIYNIS